MLGFRVQNNYTLEFLKHIKKQLNGYDSKWKSKCILSMIVGRQKGVQNDEKVFWIESKDTIKGQRAQLRMELKGNTILNSILLGARIPLPLSIDCRWKLQLAQWNDSNKGDILFQHNHVSISYLMLWCSSASQHFSLICFNNQITLPSHLSN